MLHSQVLQVTLEQDTFHSIHLLCVDLLQDMEIVISIIMQEKTAAYSIYIYITFVRNLYQYV